MKFTTTIGLSLVVFLFLCGQSAVAERLYIKYKNPSAFAKLPAGVQVTEQLPYIGSAIVEVNSQQELQALLKSGAVARVDKEVFHPAPAPVGGHKLTVAWDFALQYALDDDHATQIRGKRGADNTPWGIKAVHAEEAWALSKKGKGVLVAVLDTGIDKNHPALKANFEGGKDFVEDQNLPYDIADHVGHGTHVAGTIAAVQAADGFTGVAPKARILAGRVCSEEGCSNLAVASAINWAIAQKVDVINMSLGGFFATPAERDAVAAAEAAGVVVVAATGNDGSNRVSYPAAFPTSIAVGAVDSQIKKAGFSQYGPELDVMGPGVEVLSAVPVGSGRESEVSVNGGKPVNSTSFVGSAVVQSSLAKPVVFVGLGKTQDYAGLDLKGKFALIRRGEITFVEKVKNALAANAEGVVLFNHEAGLVNGAVTEDGSTLNIPVVMIEKTSGETITAQLDAGEEVFVSVKVATSDYAAFSGTSMATPHVAGVVALIRAANPALTPAEIRDLLKSTAEAVQGPNTKNETGSGLVNAEKAVTAATQLR